MLRVSYNSQATQYMATWQSGYAEACKALYTSSNLVVASQNKERLCAV